MIDFFTLKQSYFFIQPSEKISIDLRKLIEATKIVIRNPPESAREIYHGEESASVVRCFAMLCVQPLPWY